LTSLYQILSVRLFPPLASRFLAYGSRASTTDRPEASKTSNKQTPRPASATGNAGPLDFIANLKVPHSWFTSFYIVSVVASILWAPQLFFKAGVFPVLAAASPREGDSMTLHQVIVVWAVMLAQGSRRFYESLLFAKPSSAQMWIGHWALGIWFYMTMSVAIWIEGMRMYLIKRSMSRAIANVISNSSTREIHAQTLLL